MINNDFNYVGYNNKSITISDISCLPNLKQIDLNNLNISQELLYYDFPKGIFISFNFGDYNCQEIDQNLPTTIQYSLHCKSLNGTRLKMSYFQNIKNFIFSGSFPIIDNDITTNNYSLEMLGISSMNYPNLSNMPRISRYHNILSKDFDITSISNFSTINAESIEIQVKDDISLDFYFDSNHYFSDLMVTSKLNKPSSFINFSNHNCSTIILNNCGSEFNINGEIPIIPNSKLIFVVYQGNFTVFPNLTLFNRDLIVSNCNLSMKLPINVGRNQSITLNSNQLTGTIDKSWCNSLINVNDNKLHGEIPTCYSCYLSDPTLFNGYFNANNFSNYNQSLGCPTFAPRFKSLNSSEASFIVSGTDIGFNPRFWVLNDNIALSEYRTVLMGNEYVVNYNGTDLSNDEYFKITFEHPKPSPTITFPIIDKLPSPTSMTVTTNQLLISGKFFSSYLNYTNQVVSIGKNEICIIKDTSFFNLTCEFDSSIILSYPTIITINNDNLIRSVIINPQQGELNQLVCQNYCDDFENNYCDLSTGSCITFIECDVDCGSFGTCNNQTGICSCDSKYTGDDCSKPNPYISSIIPSNTNGGEASFFGWFGDTHSNLSILIGIQKCHPITYNTSNEIKCIAPPGNGVFDITIKQDDIEYILRDSYRYDEIIKSCPNSCTNSNQGICNTSNGECKCINNYYSFDCSLKRNNNTSNNSTVDPSTGGTNITDNQVNFQIYFKNLFEIDFSGNIVNQYSLQSNWTFNKTKDSQSNNIYKLSQTIQQSCEIVSSIEEISTSKQYSFAGSTFTLDAGSIKLTISISNYYYKSNLNTLQLQLISSADENQETDCNSKEVSTNEINTSSFKYIKISKDNRILQGRFINKVLSDGRPTYLSTDIKSEGNLIIATLNLPHFVNQSIIDPDFSVLLETDFKSECDTKNDRKWLIPVAVVVPIVGLCLIGALVYLIYIKKTVENPLKVKLKNIMKK
ncbi:hypothetical protein ACTFIV_007510 [Dictyostelium citrinum]